MHNMEVRRGQVRRGHILEKPRGCRGRIYHIMKKCWKHSSEDRPSFRRLKEKLSMLAEGLDDWGWGISYKFTLVKIFSKIVVNLTNHSQQHIVMFKIVTQ